MEESNCVNRKRLDLCSWIVHVHRMMLDLQPGQKLARGVARHLRGHGFVSVEEFVPARGLRVDVMGLGPKGEVWVVERAWWAMVVESGVRTATSKR